MRGIRIGKGGGKHCARSGHEEVQGTLLCRGVRTVCGVQFGFFVGKLGEIRAK